MGDVQYYGQLPVIPERHFSLVFHGFIFSKVQIKNEGEVLGVLEKMCKFAVAKSKGGLLKFAEITN